MHNITPNMSTHLVNLLLMLEENWTEHLLVQENGAICLSRHHAPDQEGALGDKNKKTQYNTAQANDKMYWQLTVYNIEYPRDVKQKKGTGNNKA